MTPRLPLAMVLTVVGATAGCGSSLRQEVEDIRSQQARETARLNQIRGEIARSEAQAARARGAAEFERCRAAAAAVDADVSIRQSQCFAEVAKFNACESDNAKTRSEMATGGCVIGIVATVLTGGAAGWALGGCGAGLLAGSASEHGCNAVACEVDPSRLRKTALAARGLSDPILCGGVAGVSLADAEASAVGLEIAEVSRDSVAEALALRRDDVLLRVGDAPIENTTALRAVLASTRAGQRLRVDVVRERKRLTLETTLAAPMSKLGITSTPSEPVSFVYGARIVALDPAGPAAAGGLQVGDVILGVSGTSTAGADEVAARFGAIPAGQTVPVAVARGAAPPFGATVTLASRPR